MANTMNKQKTVKTKKQSLTAPKAHNLKTAHKVFIVVLFLVVFALSGLGIFALFSHSIRDDVASPSIDQTKEEITIEEAIDFEIANIDSGEINAGETIIKQEGKNGILEVTYEVIYDDNGNEISRNKITEKVKEMPITQIVMVGTKQSVVETAPVQNNKNYGNTPSQSNNTPEVTTPTPVPDITNNQPQPIKTYSDAEIISICNDAIVAKYKWALSNGDAGSDDTGPKVTNLGNGKYQVRGWRRTGVWSFVASGCDISDGVVTNILR